MPRTDFAGPAAATVGNAPPAAPDRPHLLLVDDEPNVLNGLRRRLRACEIDIDVAASAVEAQALMERRRYRILITDHNMPGMSGLEFLRWASCHHPATVRVMLTGQTSASDMAEAVGNGTIFRYLTKPCDDADLRTTVAEALARYDLEGRNRPASAPTDAGEAGPPRRAEPDRTGLVDLLSRLGAISDSLAERARHECAPRDLHPLAYILADHSITPGQLVRTLATHLGMDTVDLPAYAVDPRAVARVPLSLCRKQLLVPLSLQGRTLLVAVGDPCDHEAIANLEFVTGLKIRAVLADLPAIEAKLAAVYGPSAPPAPARRDAAGPPAPDDLLGAAEAVLSDDDRIPPARLLQLEPGASAVRLLNAICWEAVSRGASDVHIQPRAAGLAIRYRIDGILTDAITLPGDWHRPLLSRIKIMAELDIAERRRPQDGRLSLRAGSRLVDVRISILPTLNGEKAVLRLLDRNASVIALEDLGFSAPAMARIRYLLAKPQGIVLATGPTGSGKTTTLYSLLNHDLSPLRNYVTIEDPVEFYLDPAAQIPVRERIGMDFATALRAILRQDPDVILLGEVRDAETAQVAFSAAMTGHLVYSTLHTNSTVEAFARLFDLGLKPAVIASALEGVIFQRLVRRICPHCRERAAAPDEELRLLGPVFADAPPQSSRGRGCPDCRGTGYAGRLPIYEIFLPSAQTRQLIEQGRTIQDLRAAAAAERTVSILDEARAKVDLGLTTCAEVLRVLGPQVVPR
ncbi:MAG: ATPase, T2SS/T4P/T4SS family [Candidatus Krumholzibacteriia bacterium]